MLVRGMLYVFHRRKYSRDTRYMHGNHTWHALCRLHSFDAILHLCLSGLLFQPCKHLYFPRVFACFISYATVCLNTAGILKCRLSPFQLAWPTLQTSPTTWRSRHKMGQLHIFTFVEHDHHFVRTTTMLPSLSI